MRYFVILMDDTLFQILGDESFYRLKPLFLAGSPGLRHSISDRGHRVRYGDMTDPGMYPPLHLSAEDTVVVHITESIVLRKVLKALHDVSPETSVLVLAGPEGLSADEYPSMRSVALPSLCSEGLVIAVEDLHNQKKVNRIKNILEDADKVVILMQNDPDPDAIASGLALRTLLGRNRVTAPLTSLGRVERPENLAMIKLLEIEVEPFREELLERGNKLVMVDVQPPYFQREFPQVDVLIDHHPQVEKYDAVFQDLRVNYGATATIMTEYLRAENTKPTHKLATALLYGIKSDTLLLERETDRADVAAYTYLYPHANHNLVRRIEHPELPQEGLDPLAEALKNRIVKDRVLFSHIQRCAREDLIPQFADFCLQVEGVEWAVVSGLVHDELVISVRNVGYIRSAGEVVKEAFGKLGSAGGHRSMAKAVVPLRNIDKEVDTSDSTDLQEYIVRLFLDSLNKHHIR